jgi:hypothetical protein
MAKVSMTRGPLSPPKATKGMAPSSVKAHKSKTAKPNVAFAGQPLVRGTMKLSKRGGKEWN